MSTPEPSERTRSQRREKAATDALRALIRDTLLDKFPSLSDSSLEIPLQLSLHVHCEDPGSLVFHPDLRTQLIEQTEAYLKPQEPFQPGRVFDFQKQIHVPPPKATMVFAGYDPLGHPTWDELSLLLPETLPAAILTGKELKREQLPDYGKQDKNFNILSQVIVGPLAAPKAYQKLTGSTQIALTCQVVETRDIRTHFALKLNLLSAGLLPDELHSLLQEPSLRDLGRAVQELQEGVHQLEQLALQAWTHQNNREFEQIVKQVPGLLSRFVENLRSA